MLVPAQMLVNEAQLRTPPAPQHGSETANMGPPPVPVHQSAVAHNALPYDHALYSAVSYTHLTLPTKA